MSYTFRQILVPEEKYYIKCPNAMTPIGICVHNTANDASAENEINYMINNNNEVSYHYAIDNKEVIQAIPEERNAWHAGDGRGTGNMQYISIEICYSLTGGERFIEAEKNAAQFIATILTKRGWDISHVKRHKDFSGKYCPHRTMDMGWQRFLNMIESYMFEPVRYGRDYSPAFDAEYYNNNNEDLRSAFHENAGALFNHFLVYGIYEGRQASENFNVNYYMQNYPELESNFSKDKGAYLEHWLDYGREEGRIADHLINNH